MGNATLLIAILVQMASGKILFRHPMLAVDDFRREPAEGAMEFTHMTKQRPEDTQAGPLVKYEGAGPLSPIDNPQDSIVPLSNNDYNKSDNLDTTPIAEMQAPNNNGNNANNGYNANNSYNTTTTTNNTTTNNNNTNTNSMHKADNLSKSYSNAYHKGGSNYTGDTTTYVTNNFYNPQPNCNSENNLPRDGQLAMQYLWKRINSIDDKLDRMMPLVVGPSDLGKLGLAGRKGLIISFDANSEPTPRLSVDSNSSLDAEEM